MEDHAVFVIEQNKKVLFVQRSMNKKTLPGAWAFASGTVEAGETLEQTAEREAMEELGVQVIAKKVFAKLDLPEAGVRLNFVLCQLVSGEPKPVDTDEVEQVAWMTMKDFFERYPDNQIGHGLRWLRADPDLWQAVGL
jgi:8-oxo-dGTP diphosphatase